MVGGDPLIGISSRIVKLDFGTSLNNTPVHTNWGNIGNMDFPVDLFIFQEDNNWYGLTVNYRNSTITKFSFGLGIGENKKWAIGSELTFTNNNSMTNRFGPIQNVSYENSTKFAIGGFFVPKYDSFSNYLSRIIYRGGFRYENTGLVLNDKSINDYAVTFGLGLPIGLSKINLGVELGKRGTTTSGLIEENYINVTVGLSLSDIWFIKRKID